MSLIVSVSGIRGVVGHTMTAEVAGRYASAFGTLLRGKQVVVGRDPRSSGVLLGSAVVDKLRRCGCPVVDLGIASTPATALMVCQLGAAGGIVITASHNPSEWNGLKFLSAEGSAPQPDQAAEIWTVHDRLGLESTSDDSLGTVTHHRSAGEQHVAAVLRAIEAGRIAERQFTVALDSVNGAGACEARMLLEALGCRVVHLNAEPTGSFARAPEPLAENLTDLCQAVQQSGADVGFAQDPDADRLAIVDESAQAIGEEYTLALAAKWMFEHRPGPAATNLSTSRMIDDLAQAAGPPCAVHRSPVGEAHVVAAMRDHDCVIGGEGNGGVIDPRVVLVRDSLVAMAMTLRLLADEAASVSQLVAKIPRYTMIKRKRSCKPERVAEVLKALKKEFASESMNEADGLRIDCAEGWVHVRGSNTEPIIRLIAEAKDATTAEALIQRTRQCMDPVLDH